MSAARIERGAIRRLVELPIFGQVARFLMEMTPGSPRT
jgi:hypothetical protein